MRTDGLTERQTERHTDRHVEYKQPKNKACYQISTPVLLLYGYFANPIS